VAALIRVRPAGIWSFVHFAVGFPAFHFTGVLLIAGVLATAIAGWLGAFATAAGAVGLVVGAAAFAALVVVRIRSQDIAASFEHALQEALGETYRARIPVRRSDSAGERPRLWSNPLRRRTPGVECLADLSYGDAGERNLLDIYRPAGTTRASSLPVLLWIHGGAWIVGHKAQQGLPLMYFMARHGWIAVAVNYRLGPASRFPDLLTDIKQAIAWLQMHGAEHGADARFIVTCGGSAGGHLAALAALTPNRPEYQPGFESVDTSIAGAIPIYGRFDFIDRCGVLADKRLIMDFLANKVMPCRYEDDPAAWDRASPIAQVSAQAPPMLVAHGTHDSLIPIEEAVAFVDALRQASTQPVAFAQLRGAQHAWDLFNTPWTCHTAEAVHRFAEHLYAQYARRRAVDAA
jgi:acetyl esterase/lipase